ncbi:tyrosine-type recombinase/integrase [Methylobacterium longum]|uniref:Tyrosine-type recombinase/integrase n=1 Tax=Methylobacterium longum TaxID=767694 RepID=A0ABT8AJD3_9HYPH|nr:tyrosine-type recombinase/integrase [Methylobacterium longum]MDN3569977.1 tyrosine-type recombinase/integrase [Methylobacterium longum]
MRRKSTGTDDLNAALRALKAHFLAEDTPDVQDVSRVPIADIVLAYYLQHGQHLTSRKWLKYAIDHWVRFYGETESVWAATRPARIERFIDDLRRRELKSSSINNVLTAGKAALSRSWRRGELTRQVHVPSVKVTKVQPKGRPLSVEECAAWLDASAPHFHALLFICLATGSRPEAVKQLRWAQVDFDDGLLHLNPEERAQTSKRRPVVKMPPSLIAYLRQLPRESDYVVSFRGKPVDRYYTALGESRRRAGLDSRVNLYSPRHTVARWLRKERVPFEEVAGQLGHRVPGFAITEIYAAYSPDYQALATAAIERLLQTIAMQSQSSQFLILRGARPTGHVGVCASGPGAVGLNET